MTKWTLIIFEDMKSLISRLCEVCMNVCFFHRNNHKKTEILIQREWERHSTENELYQTKSIQMLQHRFALELAFS